MSRSRRRRRRRPSLRPRTGTAGSDRSCRVPRPRGVGAGLVDGKAEPASEAAKLRTELEREERNAEALTLAVQSAHSRIAELVAANRREWRKETFRELSRKVARYKDAITALEDAREGLSSEATLVTWLDSGAGVDAATDLLGGRVGTDAGGHPPTLVAPVRSASEREIVRGKDESSWLRR
jgi:hypothetical protein